MAHLNRDLKEIRDRPCELPKQEHSRLKGQEVKRHEGNMLGAELSERGLG